MLKQEYRIMISPAQNRFSIPDTLLNDGYDNNI
jgi:hypothetical protein